MNKHVVEGTIMVVDQLNIKYSVCHLRQVYFEDETFRYEFRPYYDVIELLDATSFQGIPGLNLDLKETIYVRENKIPTFIYERTPQKNREDLWEMLDEVGLDYLDHLEWLIRTDKRYTGDRFTVERYVPSAKKHSSSEVNYGDYFELDGILDISKSNLKSLKFLLDVLSHGASLKMGDFSIDSSNRKALHSLIYQLYINELNVFKEKQRKGIRDASKENKYKGRKKVEVSIPLLDEVIKKREKKEITLKEAMKVLGIKSESTYYRRVREFKNKH